MNPWSSIRVRLGLAITLSLALSQLASPTNSSHALRPSGPPSSPKSFQQSPAPSGTVPAKTEAPQNPLANILSYISASWDSLTRSASNCSAFPDTKTDSQPAVYLPADFPAPAALNELQTKCQVRVEHLPARIAKLAGTNPNVPTPGLLYLENPYVVPGGQFNEMYGWDSYFIIRGLLRDHRLDLAKGMVENFFFEMDHYGGVLNANRTYYLTRSQPPFLSSMILAIYNAEKAAGHADPEWLRKAYGFAVRDHQQWNEPPHLAGATGLARYFDHGDGPVPEIQGDPSHYYRGVAQFLLTHGGQDEKYLVPLNGPADPKAVGRVFPVFVCDSPVSQPNPTACANSNFSLSPEFYKGDRSMRESGFDVTFRFGPFGADTHHYAAVCLNSLLFKTETDLVEMSDLLRQPADAARWRQQAATRRQRIDQLLWNPQRGLYFDYDVVRRAQSSYEYATTFYPLWAGLASPEQARAVVRNLPLFEQAGGLAMSRHESEAQWDYPYGWAPVELLAVEGLRRYGYRAEADRIAGKFLATVLRNYLLDHTIREKYDVVKQSGETRIDFGYAQNVVGFGWTNGVFLELLNTVSPQVKAQLEQQQ